MKFESIHTILIYLLVLVSSGPLLLSVELPVALAPVFIFFVALSVFCPRSLMEKKTFKNILSFIVLTFFGLGVPRYLAGEHLATLLMELALVLLLIKLYSRNNAWDYQQIIILCFICLVAATVVGFDISFGLFLILFILLIPAALMVVHMRSEMESRFPASLDNSLARLLSSTRIISWSQLLTTSIMALPILAITILLFMAIPRLGLGIGGSTLASGTISGFSSKVTIGDLENTITDNKVYMRIWPGSNWGEIKPRLNMYFRGAVFDKYNNGKWETTAQDTFEPIKRTRGGYVLAEVDESKAPVLEVMQRYTSPSYIFMPLGTSQIKTRPFVQAGLHKHRKLEISQQGILRYEDQGGVGIRYEVILGAPTPSFLPEDGANYLQLPPFSKDIIEKSNQMVKGTTLPDIVKSIIRGLRSEYEYTKVSQSQDVLKGQSNDSVERFMFEHKKGTCEHFASAAVLLLRAKGIAARLITGFSGATWNRAGGYYVVASEDAHAWVEIFDGQKWITIEPTPAVLGSRPAAWTSFFMYVSQFLDTLEMRWHRYVIDYNLSTQKEVVKNISVKNPKDWAEYTKYIIYVVIAVIGFFVVKIYRSKSRALFKKTGAEQKKVKKLQRFYLGFEKHLSASGESRPGSTTPTEYLNSKEPLFVSGFSEATEFFNYYMDVRFGKTALNEKKLNQLYKKARNAELKKIS